ncbi:MAG: C40 family peptidase [Tannerella sp.]|jgi:cell wall-associated NlpC family hydrolase|nr:C40 family peptidase [Tannerella sp.]
MKIKTRYNRFQWAIKALILWMIIQTGCTHDGNRQPYPELSARADSVRQRYVPDKRDDVFEIAVVERDGCPVVKGVTSVAEAKTETLRLLREANPAVVDSIRVLPDETVGEQVYGVINVSVADARMGADYDAEMGTQWLLGAPVQILQHAGWWRVKGAEGYVAWLMGSSFVRMDEETFDQWRNAKKIVFTDIYGFGYETPDETGQHVADLVAGNLLKYESDAGRFYKTSYPDGRTAYVLKSQSKPFEEWLSSIRLTEESIIRTALTLKGIPYVWGGTSTKGMDCSGFTKTVLMMHGIILRRDASQQVKTGIPIDLSDGYGNLRPGDLMFFGKKAQEGRKERIRHVGFYLGDNEFIHAIGYVRINSLDPQKANYDEQNTREFVRASRIIGAVDSPGIQSVGHHPLYQSQP